MENTASLCDAARIRSLFGNRSDMWVWRRIQDGTLPKPIIIGRRRYWHQADINAVFARLTATSRAGDQAA